MRTKPLVLAFDTGSPVSSVAVARGDQVLAESSVVRDGSSESILAQLDAVMSRIGAEPAAIGAVCVLRGPGSFTGLRIGLATALGLHQALGIPAAAMPTLRVLAEASESRRASRVVAVVDALRGLWFVQTFRRGQAGLEAEGPPAMVRPEELRRAEGCDLVGFGAARLAAAADLDPGRASEPRSPAGVAARLAPGWPTWDPALLIEPLYLRPPPVTPRARPDPTASGTPVP